NRLTSQQGGGSVTLKGNVDEASTVTVQGKPATVSASGTFEGKATVPAGTTNVAVQATDAGGNGGTNTYSVTQATASGTFTYDANGNMTSDGTKTYEWDAENRLTAVKQGANTLASFTYDARGQRRQKAAGGITRNYVLLDNHVAEERLSG